MSTLRLARVQLFHVSDQPDIALFQPRPAPRAPAVDGEVVWAVDEEHLPNYLLPRDCPRVTFCPMLGSTPEDVARLMGYSTARRVIAIESDWLPIVRSTRLYLYHLPPVPFIVQDAGAGYYVARQEVAPLDVTVVEDLLDALRQRDVELRITPSLWPLADAVVASSLEFSNIRMRNAKPRAETPPSNSPSSSLSP